MSEAQVSWERAQPWCKPKAKTGLLLFHFAPWKGAQVAGRWISTDVGVFSLLRGSEQRAPALLWSLRWGERGRGHRGRAMSGKVLGSELE